MMSFKLQEMSEKAARRDIPRPTKKLGLWDIVWENYGAMCESGKCNQIGESYEGGEEVEQASEKRNLTHQHQVSPLLQCQ